MIQANQYWATRYQMVWARRGAVASMSRTGNCYDNNAPVERCFSSLKNELVRHRQFQNQAEARQAIVASIEECSTRQRWHQALGYRSPEEVEQMAGESSSRCPLFPGHLRSCHHTVAVRHLFRA